jgi:rubredoxin
MARYRCRNCNNEGTFSYSGKHECPKCGSRDVQFALSIEELGDYDPLIVALKKMADDGTEQS